MKGAGKFPFVFDVAKMIAEVQSIEAERKWHNQADPTITDPGNWTAIALLSGTSTDINDPQSLRYHRGMDTPLPTELLNKSPYLASVIATFKTPILRARLMNLKPGTVIKEHRDYGEQRYSLERGFIRVHIPIRTHERVAWKLRGETVPLKPGQAWYLNVCLPHAVENLSDVQRVHLVIDMKVNDWVKNNLPSLSWEERAAGVFLRTFEPHYRRFRYRRLVPLIDKSRRFARAIGLSRLKQLLLGKRPETPVSASPSPNYDG